MTLAGQTLLAELDERLPREPESWRSAALRQIVDLFVGGAPSYTGEQVALFDEVIGRLMRDLDRLQLAETSNRLAPVENAPIKALGRLARHPDIAVCGPILEQAKALPDADLVAAADNDRMDAKLLTKIALRPHLSPAVTDVVLKRGDKAIQRAIIDNPNACISEAGFARVIMNISGDKDLAAAIAARDTVPPELRVWLTQALGE